jgi:hypothetical protein
VTKESGILLAADASPREAAEAVQDCLHNGRFPREQVRTCFRQRFDASVNYNLFADALIALQESQAAAA